MVGEKYEENKAKLRELIRTGDIKVLETKAENHACYFCRRHIDGEMRVLNLKEKEGFSEFYVDEGCYKLAQIFENYDGLPISLN